MAIIKAYAFHFTPSREEGPVLLILAYHDSEARDFLLSKLVSETTSSTPISYCNEMLGNINQISIQDGSIIATADNTTQCQLDYTSGEVFEYFTRKLYPEIMPMPIRQ